MGAKHPLWVRSFTRSEGFDHDEIADGSLLKILSADLFGWFLQQDENLEVKTLNDLISIFFTMWISTYLELLLPLMPSLLTSYYYVSLPNCGILRGRWRIYPTAKGQWARGLVQPSCPFSHGSRTSRAEVEWHAIVHCWFQSIKRSVSISPSCKLGHKGISLLWSKDFL